MSQKSPMTTRRLGVTMWVAIALLAGCGSSPPVNYYTLEALESGFDTIKPDAARLGIGPFRMPDHLRRTKIVTRGADAEVRVDDFNRWIEPVDEAMHTIVAANVDALTTDVIAVAFPYRFLDKNDLRVVGRIERFEADRRGQVELIVQWGITTYDSDFVVMPQRKVYRASADNPNDYNDIANAMSEALRLFSRDIAETFMAIEAG